MPTDPIKPVPTRTQLATAPTVLLTPAAVSRRPLAPRSRLRRFFAAEHLRDLGGTLAIVIPLTVLIWIWAEREQVKTERFQIELVPVGDAKQFARVTKPDDGIVSVTLSGPSAGMEQFTQVLKSARNQISVNVPKVNASEGPQKTVTNVLDLLSNARQLTESGLSLNSREARDTSVTFEVDQIVEREVEVALPPNLAGSLQAVVDPTTVTLRGPRLQLAELRPDDRVELRLPNAQAIVANLAPGAKSDLRDVTVVIPNAVAQRLGKDVALVQNTVGRVVVSAPQTQTKSIELARAVPLDISMPQQLLVERIRSRKPEIVFTPNLLQGVKVKGPADAIAPLELPDAKVIARVSLPRELLDRLDRGETLDVPADVVLPKGVTVDGPTPTVKVSLEPTGLGGAADVR
ncbi:MAG: hypothetical protein QM770_08230 [Tepidisphaeraceae bacterium]